MSGIILFKTFQLAGCISYNFTMLHQHTTKPFSWSITINDKASQVARDGYDSVDTWKLGYDFIDTSKLGYDLYFCQSILNLGYVWWDILNNFGNTTSYV